MRDKNIAPNLLLTVFKALAAISIAMFARSPQTYDSLLTALACVEEELIEYVRESAWVALCVLYPMRIAMWLGLEQRKRREEEEEEEPSASPHILLKFPYKFKKFSTWPIEL